MKKTTSSTIIKLKVLPEYKNLDFAAPTQAKPGDAGFDIVSAVGMRIHPGRVYVVATPFILAAAPNYLPDGSDYYIKVNSRSGMAAKNGIYPITGTIDKGYRGQIKIVLTMAEQGHGTVNNYIDISPGDRIAQLVVHKIEADNLKFELTDEVVETVRGDSGFGSSGK